MTYTALYRKKRPKSFHEVVGQTHIVRTLLNQLAAGHITHAYLFCGTRGTGKTTTARIFSRAVNCTDSQGGEPCNQCDICRGILTERNLGVIEIDAASNNGVENIRDLREEVKYPPTEGQYKVYIIDEAHMLTVNAFNALLKTLEEPPPHVIFILATTDPQKIPATILSRCQRYDFKRITVADMVDTMRGYLREEQAEAEDEALQYIASVSDGAMRDALSILDQCLSFYAGEAVTLPKVLALLGAVDHKILFDFTDALTRFDSGAALSLIDHIVRDGRDISQFTADLLRHFRDLLVASQLSSSIEILDHTVETTSHIKEQGGKMSHEALIRYIRIFSELQNELRYAPHARMALEVCTVKLCYPEALANPDTILARLDKLEQAIQSGLVVNATPEAPAETASAALPAPETTTTTTTSSATKMHSSAVDPEAVKLIQKNWKEFCRQFGNPLKMMLSLGGMDVTESGMLRLKCNDQASLGFIKERQSSIMEALQKQFPIDAGTNLVLVVQDGYNNQRGDSKQNDAKEKTVTVAPVQPSPMTEEDEWAAFGEQVDMDAGW